MSHLRKFELESEYLQAKDSFTYPTVSYIVEKNILRYMKYEFVDLGLPSGLKWAKWNIGATKPEESGLYFAWGEDKGYVVTRGEVINETYGQYNAIITSVDGSVTEKTFASGYTDYEHYDNGAFTKYNATDTLTTLANEDDGCYLDEQDMRMPTQADCIELIENTTSAWTENYNGTGINGLTLTSKTNGKSIFIPAAGYVRNDVLNSFGLFCLLWSSSLDSPVQYASRLSFYSNSDLLDVDNEYRCHGIPLRAVRQ